MYVNEIDDRDDEQQGPLPCPKCDGEGNIVTCWDDLCRADGWCSCGGGNQFCVHCDGEGIV